MIVSVNNLRNGMCLGEDIYTNDNMLIVAKDTIITNNIKNRIKLYNIEEVEISEKGHISNIPDMKDTEEFKVYRKETEAVKDSLHNSFNKLLNDVPDSSEVNKVIEMGRNLFDNNKYNSNFLDMLYSMQEFSDTTYVHCINVSMIAALLGKWLSWSNEDINILVMCGMFHDVGKLMIPENILHKPGKLSDKEYSLMKQHTILGFNKLKDNPSVPDIVKKSALLHHERCDGTGYPLMLKKEKIDKFSKVIAIADVYDALTANRVYRDAMCPFDVIAILEKEGLALYETRYIMTFLHHVLYTYLDKKVTLNNGVVAKVVEINPNARSRPVVMMAGGKVIDLSKCDGIKIDSIIN